jgi:hypothetical protein
MQDTEKSEYQEKPVAGFEKLWVWQISIDVSSMGQYTSRNVTAGRSGL